MLRYTTDS